MFKQVLFYLIISTLVFFTSVSANIIYVPGTQPTIQDGINSAMNGDTVLVADGTYLENINFKGKAITVASLFIMDGDTNHINNAIIDGSQPSHPDSGSVVRFVSGEDTTSVICGFTITGGSGTKQYLLGEWSYDGGGIVAIDAGAKIIFNKIVNNLIDYSSYLVSGGGISAFSINIPNIIVIRKNRIISNLLRGEYPIGGGIYIVDVSENFCANYIIEENFINNNVLDCSTLWKAMGGGISCDHGLPTTGTMIIRNNIITENKMYGPSSFGGGIYVVFFERSIYTDHEPNPIIYNNVIANNYSSKIGGGITVWRFAHGLIPSPGLDIVAQPAIINNTIVNNRAYDGAGMSIMNAVPLLKNNIICNDPLVPVGQEIHIKDINSAVGAWYNFYGGMITSYTNIQDTAWQGIGNISSDPMVFDSLMASNDTMYCCLSPNSPCIDAGDPDTAYNDIEDLPMNPGYGLFPAMGTVRNDMGAYGGHGSYGDIVVGIKHESKKQVLSSFSLFQNYPNPFNPTTTIEFDLPKSSEVILKVFNILGEEVTTLVSDRLSAGSYSYEWDASNLASGVYLYRLQAGDYVETRKMILMR